MTQDLPILQAGPLFEARRETVPVPELGGSVIVQGLMASQAFAVTAQRSAALRRVHQARAEHADMVRSQRAQHDERVRALPPGAVAPEFVEPDFTPPDLELAELVQYGQYTSDLLALAVVTPSGLGLYTAQQWEVVGQHHPGACRRLRLVAERLSGLDQEDVQGN